MRGRPTLFACIICGSTDLALLMGELFGCATFAALCTKHGPHWAKRSEEDELERAAKQDTQQAESEVR